MAFFSMGLSVVFSGMSYFTYQSGVYRCDSGFGSLDVVVCGAGTDYGLISEELRSGTYEQLSTLPIWIGKLFLGKFLGYATLMLIIIGGLIFYPLLIAFTTQPGTGLDWGGIIGTLAGLYFIGLAYGAMGLFASSLA